MKETRTVGITGASGSLGRELTKIFRKKGYKVIGFTHSKKNQDQTIYSPNKWVSWESGNEFLLKKILEKIDILILNHGIYDNSQLNSDYLNSIDVNALSNFRFFSIFEDLALKNTSDIAKEIWINTSEAEILPALNPSYEISKSLVGQLVTIKKNFSDRESRRKLKIKKIILGPFKSDLNPIGIMNPEFVSKQIVNLANLNFYLVIISPNPLSYILFPLREFYFFIYYTLLKIFYF